MAKPDLGKRPSGEFRSVLRKGGFALSCVGLLGLVGDAVASNFVPVPPVVEYVSWGVLGTGVVSFFAGGGFSYSYGDTSSSRN